MKATQLSIDTLERARERFYDTLGQMSVDEATMDDIVDRSWDPPVTRAVRLVSTVDDIDMHSGQAVYTRRLVING